MQSIVKRPLITEKTLALAAKGFYTFAVAKTANKNEIRNELEKLYKVEVTDIRTITLPGKTRRVGRRMVSVTKPTWKKATVRLAPGQKIDAFEVTPKKDEK